MVQEKAPANKNIQQFQQWDQQVSLLAGGLERKNEKTIALGTAFVKKLRPGMNMRRHRIWWKAFGELCCVTSPSWTSVLFLPCGNGLGGVPALCLFLVSQW